MILRTLKLLLIAVAVLMAMALFALVFSAMTQSSEIAILLVTTTVIGGFLLLSATIAAAVAARRRRAAAVLGYLEQAVRHNLPLPRIVRAIGEGESRRFARDMTVAQQALQEGAPLAVVLSAVPQIPIRVLALLAGAERVGRLPQVLTRLMDQRRAAVSRRPGYLPFYRTYPLVFGLAFVAITTMFAVFVGPKFEQVFKDFKTPLPEITRITLHVARDVGPWMALLLMVFMVLLMIATATSRWRGGALGLVESPFDWLANRIPWIGRMRLCRALGDTLEFAADAVEAGRPMDATLIEASQVSANSRVRRMVNNWVVQLSIGRSIDESARIAGLPSMVCSMMKTASNTPDLAEVLRFLGRYYSTRFSRAAAILEAAVIPLIAIVMGAMAALLALSIFLPMISLINRVSVHPKGI
jgi:type II secretory pathway component PulF